MTFSKISHLGLTMFLATFGFVESQNLPVVVIGAGLAGLTTAYRLQQKGLDVHVYEARPRVGGRVFTVKMGERLGELGGQNIPDGGGAENMRRLISEMNLELVETRIPLGYSYFDGKTIIPSSSLYMQNFDPDSLQLQLEDLSQKAENLRDVLSALLKEEDPLYKILSVRLAAYEGASIEKLSPLYINTLYYMLLGGLSAIHQEKEIEIASIRGGNALLPEALAQSLEGKVHLDMQLVAVSKTTDGSYELTFKNGQKVTAKYLVLAIPCPVYEDIVFEKNVIPEKRLEAIRKIQYGTNAKILFPCLKLPLKPRALINGRAIGWLDVTGWLDVNRNVVTLYYTGEAGRFSPETILETYVQDQPMMEMGFPEILSFPSAPVFARDETETCYEGAVGFSWSNDPYAKGSYSFVAAGQEALFTSIVKEGDELVKALFAPIDKTLYFAGEHTTLRREIIGTMEAACESGERTARLIEKTDKKEK